VFDSEIRSDCERPVIGHSRDAEVRLQGQRAEVCLVDMYTKTMWGV